MPSVGSVGDSYDNALAETINGLFKAEVIHRRGPWRSVETVEFATLEWVDWFNNRRLLEPIGNIPPAEAEARYYAQANERVMAASLKPNSLRQTRRGSRYGGAHMPERSVLKLFGLAAVMALASAVTPALAQDKKPNIVLILMDNLGYGELGVYGGGILRGAPTPNIDELAKEGMVALNFNVEAQCTPSRSALMTGRLSIRSGTYEVPIGGGPDGLTQWEITIAQLLSSQGYATGMWGKWHLGSDEDRLPNHRGFDEWYGIPRSYDEAMWPSLNETNNIWPSVGNK